MGSKERDTIRKLYNEVLGNLGDSLWDWMQQEFSEVLKWDTWEGYEKYGDAFIELPFTTAREFEMEKYGVNREEAEELVNLKVVKTEKEAIVKVASGEAKELVKKATKKKEDE